jgi:hypothetical protein
LQQIGAIVTQTVMMPAVASGTVDIAGGAYVLACHRRIQTIHATHPMHFVLTRKLLIYQLIHDWMLVRRGEVCM